VKELEGYTSSELRKLPLEDELLDLFLEHYADAKIQFPVLSTNDLHKLCDLHQHWLSNSTATLLFESTTKPVDRRKKYRFLTYLSWMMVPSNNLPFLPETHEIQSFKVSVIAFYYAWV
jgi:hypothetical protein